MFVCTRCGNTDERYIGHINGKPYCRKCIAFSGEQVQYTSGTKKEVALELHYPLSTEQRKISEKIIANYRNGIDTLVYAVCGSGKTEISYGVLAYAVSKGLRVGFALPRRDVVIELYWRIKEAFKTLNVVAVYGQHTNKLEGDIVILTTHQLFRYPNYFDLLVMDEIDAFPYKGNKVLVSLYKKSLRGRCVMMSATPSEEILEEFKKEGHEILELRTRFHRKPIPVPVVIKKSKPAQEIEIIKQLIKYQKEGKPCFVFAPTQALCESLFFKIRLLVKKGDYVHSKRENRDQIISNLKKGKLSYLVTTSVLERGVTVKDLQVIIYMADDERIYDSSTLIQTAGRAGRKMDAPNGEVTFYVEKDTKEIRNAITEIDFCNTFL